MQGTVHMGYGMLAVFAAPAMLVALLSGTPYLAWRPIQQICINHHI